MIKTISEKNDQAWQTTQKYGEQNVLKRLRFSCKIAVKSEHRDGLSARRQTLRNAVRENCLGWFDVSIKMSDFGSGDCQFQAVSQ